MLFFRVSPRSTHTQNSLSLSLSLSLSRFTVHPNPSLYSSASTPPCASLSTSIASITRRRYRSSRRRGVVLVALLLVVVVPSSPKAGEAPKEPKIKVEVQLCAFLCLRRRRSDIIIIIIINRHRHNRKNNTPLWQSPLSSLLG